MGHSPTRPRDRLMACRTRVTVSLTATPSAYGWSESYRVSRRPHFLGAAVRARHPILEIEETGMLSRQAAVELRPNQRWVGDTSELVIGESW